jgi:hypothetical protein
MAARTRYVFDAMSGRTPPESGLLELDEVERRLKPFGRR